MDQPGMLGSGVSNDGDMMRMIAELQRQVRELAAANPFAPMGVTPTADGFTVTGTETIDGGLIVNGPETVNGPLTINGAAEITGTLSLPAGIIGNDALASPVQMQTSSNYINNYAITTTSTIRASLTLTVPAGFTQAVVIANPTAMGQNSTASTDYLYAQAVIQGINGGELYTSCGAGLAVGIASPVHMTLTGLTGGGTITVGVATRAGFSAWAASTANQANIYATAIYLR